MSIRGQDNVEFAMMCLGLVLALSVCWQLILPYFDR